MDAKGLLALGDLILAGDLKFMTNTEEVWGASTLIDPLVVFFKEIFSKNHLADIMPAEVVPT
jgi:hypothetical protein